MSVGNLAGFYHQQTFAGNTRPGPEPPTAAGASLTEAVHSSGLVSELDSLFAGGLHPEMFLTPASRDLAAASSSVRTAEGGLAPRLGSALAPGPAGAAVAARASSVWHHILGK